MLLSKRITKLRTISSSTQNEDTHKPRIIKDNKKSGRCKFTEIPFPSKYVQSASVYSILGDLPLAYYNGKIMAEISLYNELKAFKDISVTKTEDEQAIITIRPTLRTDKEVPHWTEFVDTLNETQDADLQEWAKTIKSYCHTYSKVMQRQSRKKMKSEPRKKFFYQVTDETNSQNKKLMDNYPCLKMKFRIKNHQNQLKEVVVNEGLVKVMGYSTESFVTTVLQEGFPQMLPHDNPLALSVIKPFIQNYFTIGDYGYHVDELVCPLLMKNGFARNMRFKSCLFMNYEDTVFGLDLVVAITGVGEPYLVPKHVLGQDLNINFVDLRCALERETGYFASTFYEESVSGHYTNILKICTLKELEDTTDNTEVKVNDEGLPIKIKHESPC